MYHPSLIVVFLSCLVLFFCMTDEAHALSCAPPHPQVFLDSEIPLPPRPTILVRAPSVGTPRLALALHSEDEQATPELVALSVVELGASDIYLVRAEAEIPHGSRVSVVRVKGKGKGRKIEPLTPERTLYRIADEGRENSPPRWKESPRFGAFTSELWSDFIPVHFEVDQKERSAGLWVKLTLFESGKREKVFLFPSASSAIIGSMRCTFYGAIPRKGFYPAVFEAIDVSGRSTRPIGPHALLIEE